MGTNNFEYLVTEDIDDAVENNKVYLPANIFLGMELPFKMLDIYKTTVIIVAVLYVICFFHSDSYRFDDYSSLLLLIGICITPMINLMFGSFMVIYLVNEFLFSMPFWLNFLLGLMTAGYLWQLFMEKLGEKIDKIYDEEYLYDIDRQAIASFTSYRDKGHGLFDSFRLTTLRLPQRYRFLVFQTLEHQIGKIIKQFEDGREAKMALAGEITPKSITNIPELKNFQKSLKQELQVAYSFDVYLLLAVTFFISQINREMNK